MTHMTSPESESFHIHIGERIMEQVSLTLAEIATFAKLSGDLNPLHYDESYAQQTRFGDVIVSGPHLTSLMMGLTATHFSQGKAMLGLEFTFRFHKAVKVGETINMEWEVVSAEPKASLNGEIVAMEGKATNQQGQMLLTGTGKVLVTEKL
jgi:acyl dehydratase